MARLPLSLLGSFAVTLDGAPRHLLPRQHGAGIVAYLAMHLGLAYRCESLAALLWPDHPETVALQNMRQALRIGRSLILLSQSRSHCPRQRFSWPTKTRYNGRSRSMPWPRATHTCPTRAGSRMLRANTSPPSPRRCRRTWSPRRRSGAGRSTCGPRSRNC